MRRGRPKASRCKCTTSRRASAFSSHKAKSYAAGICEETKLREGGSILVPPMELANAPHLHAAPPAPVAPNGTILFGRYLGHTGPIDWAQAGRSRLWRFLHAKRWQYASILGDECVTAVAIADLGWATTAFAYLFNRSHRRVLADVSLIGLPHSGQVADHAGPGALSCFRRGAIELSIEYASHGWKVTVQSPTLTLQTTLVPSPTDGTICAIGRVPGGVANCTHKTHGLTAIGNARAGDADFRLDGCFGALDHTSGLLARETKWRWASGTSASTAINLVDGFHEPFENAIWRDGQVSALGPVTFSRDAADPMATWRIRAEDGSVDLAFAAEGVRSQDKNLGFAMSRWIQPLGTYSGTVLGTAIGPLVGVLEDHVARW